MLSNSRMHMASFSFKIMDFFKFLSGLKMHPGPVFIIKDLKRDIFLQNSEVYIS